MENLPPSGNRDAIPRPEYPRPQFVRSDWLNLNGVWQFEIDRTDSGWERGIMERPLSGQITVPFCPESILSGIGDTDFMDAVWYRRSATVPSGWSEKHILLHFQAVDYDATVWIRKEGGAWIEVGRHRGGFSPFTCNLKDTLRGGDRFEICLRARDYHVLPQPRGKQSQRYDNYGCFYTRTTGIWQTVWMEPVPDTFLSRPRITPDLTNGVFYLHQRVVNQRAPLSVSARLSTGDTLVATSECVIGSSMTATIILPVPPEHRYPWCIDNPHLYDLTIELKDNGVVLDQAQSYAGLRDIAVEGRAVKLNGHTIFQRLVLDQGYYPDGIMTAPTDADLVRDIEISQAAGFNGARLHQKIFEERFYYHADRMGYLCWGEFPDWGCRGAWPNEEQLYHGITFAAQWIEVVERDYSHPCIVGWCPLNETYQELRDEIVELDDASRAMYVATKAADSTRPVLDASGYSHRVPETDIYDCHDYEQNPRLFARNHAGLKDGHPFLNGPRDRPWNITYQNQPFFVSEFGGIWWNEEIAQQAKLEGYTEKSWGYGQRPRTKEEVYKRFEDLTKVLLDNSHMFGYCYTQLTDVYQEENGIYDFHRKPKFDIERIRVAQQRKAAIEKLYEKQDRKALKEKAQQAVK